jgi:hypothetical protein
MNKTIYTLAVVALLVAGPVHGYTGMSADELRSEIARLTRVADTIRAQLLMFGDNATGVTANTTTSAPACLQVNTTMNRGDSGESVRLLQQFLVQQGVYSSTLVTAYFGPATEAGVQAWQSRHGIVSSGTPSSTGYGRVGPSTLRAMRSGCTAGTYSGATTAPSTTVTTVPSAPVTVAVERYTLGLNTTRGSAPLTVIADFTITGSSCTSYVLDWGDGSLPVSYNSNSSTDCTALPINITTNHIYTSPGTYTVRFKNGKAPITSISEVNKLTITVD